MSGRNPSVILYDELGNPVSVIADTDGYRLQTEDLHSAITRSVVTDARARYRSGFLASSSAGPKVIRFGIFVEQGAAAQRSIVSTSASDTSAGTGAQKVIITYYDNLMNGPLTEEITMSGLTPVDTVATDIRFIEEMEVLEAGSSGRNVGVIQLHTGLAGAGVTFSSINAFQTNTLYAHHYVAPNKRCLVTHILGGWVDGPDAALRIHIINPLLSTSPAFLIRSPLLRLKSNDSTKTFIFDPPISVLDGPARVDLVIGPDDSSAGIITGGFGFYEV